jgi:hypothetical protein
LCIAQDEEYVKRVEAMLEEDEDEDAVIERRRRERQEMLAKLAASRSQNQTPQPDADAPQAQAQAGMPAVLFSIVPVNKKYGPGKFFSKRKPFSWFMRTVWPGLPYIL